LAASWLQRHAFAAGLRRPDWKLAAWVACCAYLSRTPRQCVCAL